MTPQLAGVVSLLEVAALVLIWLGVFAMLHYMVKTGLAWYETPTAPESTIDFEEAPMISIIHRARDGKTYYIMGNKALDRYAAFEMCDWATLEKWFLEDEEAVQ
jgi:hypothetical protein